MGKVSEFLLNRARNWKTTWTGVLALLGGLGMMFTDIGDVLKVMSTGAWPDWNATAWAFTQALTAISAGLGLIFAKDAAVSGTAVTTTPAVVPPVPPPSLR